MHTCYLLASRQFANNIYASALKTVSLNSVFFRKILLSLKKKAILNAKYSLGNSTLQIQSITCFFQLPFFMPKGLFVCSHLFFQILMIVTCGYNRIFWINSVSLWYKAPEKGFFPFQPVTGAEMERILLHFQIHNFKIGPFSEILNAV